MERWEHHYTQQSLKSSNNSSGKKLNIRYLTSSSVSAQLESETANINNFRNIDAATERQLIGGNFAVALHSKRPPKIAIPKEKSLDIELGGQPGTAVTNSP